MRTADDLVHAMVLDIWPGSGAIVDFGIDSQAHYEALHKAVRKAGVTGNDLHAVVGDGPRITALLDAKDCNPLGLKFLTSYDGLFDDEDPEGDLEDLAMDEEDDPADLQDDLELDEDLDDEPTKPTHGERFDKASGVQE